MEYAINLFWDAEAAVWIATSKSVKGLVLESGSLDALIERVRIVIPELLSLNEPSTGKPISLCFHAERREQAYV